MADQSSEKKLYIPPGKSAATTSGKASEKTPGNRRKGERGSNQQNKEGERSQPLDAAAAAAASQVKRTPPNIITPKDCSQSEASELLNKRWADAIHQYNDPDVDLSERPVMYYGGSVWGRLPHQILASANNTLPPPSNSTPEGRHRGLLTPRQR